MRFLFVLILLVTPNAFACGYCVEDKIAATYDHAVVSRAAADRHQVVFFHVDGRAAPARLRAAADTVGDRGSARASEDGLTLSVAFDPRRVPLGTLQSGIEKKLGVSLLPLRLMERPAELKAVR